MARFGKLGALIGVAEAARRYARSNPDKAGKYLDQAAQFVDKQTKGKYTNQISGAARKAKDAAGIPQPGYGYGAPGTTQPYQGQQPYPGQQQPYPGQPQSGQPTFHQPDPQQPTQQTPPPSQPGNGAGTYGTTENHRPPQPPGQQQYEPPRY